ncbi:MAG TPA: response regulator transcription factor [Candidatus Dormibacteraeota bacterium]
MLIVDDHPVVRKGLSTFLSNEPDLEVIGAAEDGESAVQVAATDCPDVVLMDLSMPGMGGIEATKVLMAQHPDIKVLMLTSFGGHERMVEALQAGAVGYVVKDSAPTEILRAVRSVGRPDLPEEE